MSGSFSPRLSDAQRILPPLRAHLIASATRYPLPAGLNVTVSGEVEGLMTTWSLAFPVAPSESVTITDAVYTPPLMEVNVRVCPVPDAYGLPFCVRLHW